MAKKATSSSDAGAGKKGKGSTSSSTAVARTQGKSGGGSGSQDGMNASEAFIKLLQSPLVADLLAVAATAALAALAEHGFNSRGAGDNASSKRAGKAVKEAGKAAAAAIGRRLSTEIEEIRAASKNAKAGAGV